VDGGVNGGEIWLKSRFKRAAAVKECVEEDGVAPNVHVEGFQGPASHKLD